MNEDITPETAPESATTASPVVDFPVADLPTSDLPTSVAPTSSPEISPTETFPVIDTSTETPSAQRPAPSAQPEARALPEADLPEPPRPLVAGAFLGGEYEVKELVARGLTNFYLAFGGDYAAPVPKLVAEREAPHNSGHTGEKPKLMSALFPPSQFVGAQDREYLIFEWTETLALQDWREASNDTRYLQAMSTLVAGLRELEADHLHADFSRDTLRLDERGNLRYFGFVDCDDENSNLETPNPKLQILRTLNSFLLRQVFGEAATIRLDDQWGALAMSEEVKTFARGLESEYSSLSEVEAALQALQVRDDLRADAALLSDVGQEREVNEDSGMIVRLGRAGHERNFDLELYVVSDGMGGHEGGEVASDLTLSTLHRALLGRAELDWQDNVAVRAALVEVIEEVNAAVVALTEEPKYRATRAKPGATLTFALRVGARIFFGNVGDSRAYKWSTRAGLERVTKDHSYVQTLIDSGQISEDEAWEHPDGSIITAHIGMTKLKQPDVFLRLATPGDKILIVSDGVIDMLHESQIEPILHEDSPHVICRELVDASNAAGGHDNITAVCVGFR